MYENMVQGTCEKCGAIFEYYIFAMVRPARCIGCQREISGKSRIPGRKLYTRRVPYVKYVKKVKVIEEKPETIAEVVVKELVKEVVKNIDIRVPRKKVRIVQGIDKNIGIDLDAIISYKPIPGVSQKLMAKYKDIKKVTEIANK